MTFDAETSPIVERIDYVREKVVRLEADLAASRAEVERLRAAAAEALRRWDAYHDDDGSVNAQDYLTGHEFEAIRDALDATPATERPPAAWELTPDPFGGLGEPFEQAGPGDEELTRPAQVAE